MFYGRTRDIAGAMMTEDLLFVLENSAGALSLWKDMMFEKEEENVKLSVFRLFRWSHTHKSYVNA